MRCTWLGPVRFLVVFAWFVIGCHMVSSHLGCAGSRTALPDARTPADWAGDWASSVDVAVDCSENLCPSGLTCLKGACVPAGAPEGLLGVSGHACLVLEGELLCWGNNLLGQVGNGVLGVGPPDAPPVDLPAIEMVTTGYDFTCALTMDGVVYCWGRAEEGRLGAELDVDVVATPRQVEGMTDVQDLCSTAIDTCALDLMGRVWCWGPGFVEDGPTQVEALPAAVELDCGDEAVCAATDTGALWCWGGNRFGESSPADSSSWTLPTAVAQDVARFDIGGHSTCVWDESGGAHCWGIPLGDGSWGSDEPPVAPVPMPSEWDEVVAVLGYPGLACRIEQSGKARCRGDDDAPVGHLNHVPGEYAAVPLGQPVVALSTTGNSGERPTALCALTSGMDVFCWGHGQEGLLGAEYFENAWSPSQSPFFNRHARPGPNSLLTLVGNFLFLSTAEAFGEMGAESFSSWSWGVKGDVGRYKNGGGVLGLCLAGTTMTPYSCQLYGIGEVWCWGVPGGDSQGNTVKNAVYGVVPLPATAVDLTCGTDVACATLEDGRLTCWGAGVGHKEPQGRADEEWPPKVTLSLDVGVVQASVGSNKLCIVLEEGGVVCYGPLPGTQDAPLGAQTAVTLPLAGPHSKIRVGVGHGHACAAVGGKVYCWGDNDAGQVSPNGGKDHYATPTPPFDNEDCDTTTLALGAKHACILCKSDGVICWGDNTDGQLGIGGKPPVDGAGLADTRVGTVELPEDYRFLEWFFLRDVSLSASNTCISTMGDARCWGDNEYMQVSPNHGSVLPKNVVVAKRSN